MPDEYDGIILGTGHNSLVLQAYMARSGLRVLAVDRAPAPGGGLATIENPRVPGFRHNTHSFFHRALTSMPWYRDLELERHGARYIEPELNVALILSDGRSLEWWTNFEKTAESFGEFSKRDAATLRRWVEEFRPIVERILIPEAQSPPLPPEQRQGLLGRSRLGRRLLEVAALSLWSLWCENSSTMSFVPAFCSSMDCARSTCGLGDLAILFRRSWPGGTWPKCAWAVPPTWRRP